MDKVLFINACIRPNSRTFELAKLVLGNLSKEVEEVNLYAEKLLPLDLDGLELRDKCAVNNDFSSDVFSLAKQFAKAETIVIAAP